MGSYADVAQKKKLSSKAVQAKMDLHDLSEELPTNWERIPEVAQKTFQINLREAHRHETKARSHGRLR